MSNAPTAVQTHKYRLCRQRADQSTVENASRSTEGIRQTAYNRSRPEFLHFFLCLLMWVRVPRFRFPTDPHLDTDLFQLEIL